MIKKIIIFFSLASILLFNTHLSHFQPATPHQSPPSTAIKYFSFGYNESVGDSFWLTGLQKFGECEQDRGGSPYATSGAKMGLDRTPACSMGIVYYILDLILEIIPKFHYAALVGPIVLSTVVDDIDGATLLFEKAIRNYPNDWVILSRAASHYMSEVEDPTRASELYLRAVKNGGPLWMGLYASKLTSQTERYEVARRILMNFFGNKDLSEREKKWVDEKLKSLDLEIKKRQALQPALKK